MDYNDLRGDVSGARESKTRLSARQLLHAYHAREQPLPKSLPTAAQLQASLSRLAIALQQAGKAEETSESDASLDETSRPLTSDKVQTQALEDSEIYQAAIEDVQRLYGGEEVESAESPDESIVTQDVPGTSAVRNFVLKSLNPEPCLMGLPIRIIADSEQLRKAVETACRQQLGPQAASIWEDLKDLYYVKPRSPTPEDIQKSTARQEKETAAYCKVAALDEQKYIGVVYTDSPATGQCRISSNWATLGSLYENTAYTKGDIEELLKIKPQTVIRSPQLFGLGESLTDRVNRLRGFQRSPQVEFLDREAVLEEASVGTGFDLLARLGAGWESPFYEQLRDSLITSNDLSPSIELLQSSRFADRMKKLCAVENDDLDVKHHVLRVKCLDSHPDYEVEISLLQYCTPNAPWSSFVLVDTAPINHLQHTMGLKDRITSDCTAAIFRAFSPKEALPLVNEEQLHASIRLRPIFNGTVGGATGFFAFAYSLAEKEAQEGKDLAEEFECLRVIFEDRKEELALVDVSKLVVDTRLHRLITLWRKKSIVNRNIHLELASEAKQVQQFLEEHPNPPAATLLEVQTACPSIAGKIIDYLLYMIISRPSQRDNIHEMSSKFESSWTLENVNQMSEDAQVALDEVLKYNALDLRRWPASLQLKVSTYWKVKRQQEAIPNWCKTTAGRQSQARSNKKFRKTESGKNSVKKWNNSDGGRAANRKFFASTKGAQAVERRKKKGNSHFYYCYDCIDTVAFRLRSRHAKHHMSFLGVFSKTGQVRRGIYWRKKDSKWLGEICAECVVLGEPVQDGAEISIQDRELIEVGTASLLAECSAAFQAIHSKGPPSEFSADEDSSDSESGQEDDEGPMEVDEPAIASGTQQGNAEVRATKIYSRIAHLRVSGSIL